MSEINKPKISVFITLSHSPCLCLPEKQKLVLRSFGSWNTTTEIICETCNTRGVIDSKTNIEIKVLNPELKFEDEGTLEIREIQK